MAWKGRLQEVTPGCLSESGRFGCSRWREQRARLGGEGGTPEQEVMWWSGARSQGLCVLASFYFPLKAQGSPSEIAKQRSKVRYVLESKFPGTVRSAFKGAILGKRKVGRKILLPRNKEES